MSTSEFNARGNSFDELSLHRGRGEREGGWGEKEEGVEILLVLTCYGNQSYVPA